MATRDHPETQALLRKLGSTEPIFILRAQDELAPDTVDFWCHYAGNNDVPKDKIAAARALAAQMRAWQQAHPAEGGSQRKLHQVERVKPPD